MAGSPAVTVGYGTCSGLNSAIQSIHLSFVFELHPLKLAICCTSTHPQSFSLAPCFWLAYGLESSGLVVQYLLPKPPSPRPCIPFLLEAHFPIRLLWVYRRVPKFLLKLAEIRPTFWNFTTRPQTMAMLTPETVGMVPYAHAFITPAATFPGEIRYLHLAQEATFSMGVFVLPPGACIPLHDHPNM